MDGLLIRQVTSNDAYTVARLRQRMWDGEHAEPSLPAYREELFVYWHETIRADQATGWVAELDGAPVGVAMLLFHRHPPRPYGPILRGYVTGVFVDPAHRRQGIGKALMAALINWSRAQGFGRLELRSSDSGQPLYQSLGFAPRDVWMLEL